MNRENAAYLDSLGVEYIPKEIKSFIINQSIKTNTYGIQAYDSIMCGYLCFDFINFVLQGNSLLDYKNLVSPNDYEKVIKQCWNIFTK